MAKQIKNRWLSLLLLIAVLSVPGAAERGLDGETRHCLGGFRHEHHGLRHLRPF